MSMIHNKKGSYPNFSSRSPLKMFAKWLLVLPLSCFAEQGFTQVADSLEKQFARYNVSMPAEKIYLQTDKSFYLGGEIIWFKIYNVDASRHQPMMLSKVAYAELLDANNKPVAEAKIELKNAQGDGSFYIPLQVNSGNYKLRAYTNWMKNFPADFYFEKPVTIINTQRAPSTAATEKKTSYDIQFFPEGGNLVKGISSKVGFRVTDQYGKGQEFNGALVTNAGDTVARFAPSQFGIGDFTLLNPGSEILKAVLRFADGSVVQKELPATTEHGYALSVSAGVNGDINLNIQTNKPEVRQVFVLAHTRQLLRFVMPVALNNGKAVVTIKEVSIGEGITHITIFDEAKQPVAERLYFKMPSQRLAINITPSDSLLTSRKKITIAVSSQQNDRPVPARMAMSVYRLDSLQDLPEQDIESYLFLSADLKGNIESAASYFKLPAEKARTAIDQLMLTHGWRRFVWTDLTGTKTVSFPPEYNGHLVTAKITDVRNGSAVSDVQGFMSVPGVMNIFSTSSSDQNGIVKFEMKNRYGPAEMILQAKQNADTVYQVELQNPFSNKYSSTALPFFSLPLNTPRTLLDHHIGVQVRNVYTGQQLRKFYSPNSDSSSFYPEARFRYMLDDYTRFKTMEEILREYVKLVFVKKRGNNFYIEVYDEEARKSLQSDALVLIDGVPVFDVNKVMALDPLKLRKLEVINNTYIYGNYIYDGILHWMSYDHDLGGYELDRRAVTENYEGYQLKREFYSPVYDKAENLNLPDFRNVLFWNPAIATSEQDSTRVEFFTSDLPGKYAVVAEGIADNGVCGSTLRIIEVK